MEDYAIPKFEVPVEIRLPGLEARRVRLHLAQHAEHHFGPERVSDLLEGEKRFLPVTSSDGTGFLRRQALLHLTVAGDAEPSDEPEEGAQTFCVDVYLEDGTRLRGRVSYLLPRERGRLQDFLNSEERFMAVRDGPRVHYVNKSRVAWIHPLPSEEHADH